MRGLGWVLCLLGVPGLATAGIERVIVDPEPVKLEEPQRFGTDPSRAWMPPTAIDSPRPPEYVVAADARDDEPLPVFQLAPDTWMFFGNIAEVDPNNRGFNGNAGFVITDEGVVVIDALGTPRLGRRMIATIRSKTDRPIRYLIVTHAHPDHFYGAVAFADIPGIHIVSHEGTEGYVHSERIERSVAYRKAFIAEDMRVGPSGRFQAIVPDILIGGPRYGWIELRVGEEVFRIYNTGTHHSHGDLVVHQKKADIAWISDLAFNGRVTFMGDGHTREMLENLDWLMRELGGVRLMVPGHGSAQTAPFPMVAKTRAYIEALRTRMAEAVEEGLDLQEAVEAADLPEWRNVRLYGLNHRLNANFVYREMEQELFE
jgi:glyoxylase-like metal-dependent hydrolase (beta-lactamase superfamily II)